MCNGEVNITCSSLSDEDLCMLAAKDDYNALTLLISRYIPVVKGRVAGYCYYGTEIEAEDLAQEGMIGLLSAIRRYKADGNASFKTFAILCIDRSIISAVRVTLARKRVPKSTVVSFDRFDNDSLAFLGIPSPSNNPEDAFILAEDVRILKTKLSELLSPLENKIFFLYLGGCGYDVIARRLNITEKAVDNALYRVKKKLKGIERA